MSSERCSADAYRNAGSLRIARSTIASRSPPRPAARVLGLAGSLSHTTRSSSSGSPVSIRYGFSSVSSSYSTTPSEYTSLAVVTVRPRICSGLAYSGVRMRSSVDVSSRAAAPSPDDLGDPEVEQRRHALGRDEDVAGLQVAVDDEVLVGVLHRGADLAEEPQPVPDREAAVPAVVEQRNALDVLHDEVRLARSVVPPSISRAMPGCSSAAAIWRSLRKRWRTSALAMPERTSLIATFFWNSSSARRARYTWPMPPVPDLLEDRVRADALAEPAARRLGQLERRRPAVAGRIVEELPVPLVRREQGLDLPAQAASPEAAAAT